MKLTREKQWGRVGTYNIEIGNVRDSALKQANLKWENNFTKEEIVDLGDSRFLVQREKSDEVCYLSDMKSW